MVLLSETKLFVMSIFTAIGIIATLLVIGVYLYYTSETIMKKFRKPCFQCGDDIDKTRKVGEGYYCDYCIKVGNAEFNEGRRKK